jgi:hypothetical protein
MNRKLTQLAERRAQLVAQAAAQRAALGASIEPWRAPLAVADQGLVVLRFVKRNAFWIVGGLALFAAVRPHVAGKWLRRGWLTWQVIHKLSRGR